MFQGHWLLIRARFVSLLNTKTSIIDVGVIGKKSAVGRGRNNEQNHTREKWSKMITKLKISICWRNLKILMWPKGTFEPGTQRGIGSQNAEPLVVCFTGTLKFVELERNFFWSSQLLRAAKKKFRWKKLFKKICRYTLRAETVK